MRSEVSLIITIVLLVLIRGNYHISSIKLPLNEYCDHREHGDCSRKKGGFTELTVANEPESSSHKVLALVNCSNGSEFACLSRLQCIPVEFVCDRQYDCQDQSDEIGCAAPAIISEPPKSLSALEHGAINISCEASGMPKPFVYWTHNGSKLTARESEISTSSVTQIGTSGKSSSYDVDKGSLLYYVMSTIQIVYLNQNDAGYWACHAINNQGNISSIAETLLTVRQKASVCRDPPYFYDLATSKDECLKCYCSGVSDTCFSSNYYLSELHYSERPTVVNLIMTVMPIHSVVNKKLSYDNTKYVSYSEISQGYSLPNYSSVLGQNYNEDAQSMLNNIRNNIFYYYKIQPNAFIESKEPSLIEDHTNSHSMSKNDPENFEQTGSLLKSYGGYLRFSFTYNVASGNLDKLQDESTIWLDGSQSKPEVRSEQGEKKETISALQDLADVVLLCRNGQVIYHNFDIYSTSIVPNQSNHLSVPLMENHWQIGSNNISNNRLGGPKKSSSVTPTAPYNYNVNFLAPSNDSILSSSNNHSFDPIGNLGDHRIHTRSEFFDAMDSTEHSSPISLTRDQFMHCLSEVNVLYIRAIFDIGQVSFNISSIYLDTAVGSQSKSTIGTDLQALLVEHCVCPSGYEGTSCEICSKGYDRDLSSSSKSSCKMKIRSRSTSTTALIPHYSNYYNQTASILPNLSTNTSDEYTSSPASEDLSRVPVTNNCSCVPSKDYANCDPVTNQCKNCKVDPQGYYYCDRSDTLDTQKSDTDLFLVEIEEPKNVTVSVGTSVKFRCTVRLNSTSSQNVNSIITNQTEVTLLWSRLFRPSAQYRSSLSIVAPIPEGSELFLTNVTLDDSGIYVCEQGTNISNILLNSTEVKNPRRDFAYLSVKGLNGGGNDDDDDAVDYDEEDKMLKSASNETKNNGASTNIDDDYYDVSQFMLTNLSHVPNVRIIPDYAEVPVGASLQLICLGELDEPDLYHVEWSHLPQNKSFSEQQDQSLAYEEGDSYTPLPNVIIRQNTLSIDSTDDQNAGLYTCKANNRFNVTTEATARVIIVPAEETSPQVLIEPDNAAGHINDSLEIRCFASGYPGPKLSWIKVDASHLSNRSDFIEMTKLFTTEQVPANEIHMYRHQYLTTDRSLGSTTSQTSHTKRRKMIITSMSIMRIDNLRAAHSGQYICRANNIKGSNQASANIDVEYQVEPTIVVSPVEQVVRLDKGLELTNIKFECRVLDGKPIPSISWFKISTSSGGVLTNTKNVLDNRSRFRTTELSNLVPIPVLVNVTPSNNQNIEIEESLNSGARVSVLNFKRITMKEEGAYACVAENNIGRHSLVVHLQVIVPATIKIMQMNPLKVSEDDSFQLECIISGHPIPVDIEWSKRNKGSYFSFVSKQNPLEEQERAVLRFDHINMDDSGEYSCQARNTVDDSMIEDTLVINVNFKSSPLYQGHQNYPATTTMNPMNKIVIGPQLITRPSKILAVAGSNVTIDCLAMSGRQPIVIEWNHLGHLKDSTPASAAVSRFYDQDIKPMKTLLGYDRPAPTLPRMLQFGSKLKLFNISQYHEGVYQCIGHNKNGREVVQTELRIMESQSQSKTVDGTTDLKDARSQTESITNNETTPKTILDTKSANESPSMQIKTQSAIVGSNIELTCRVEGVVDPAISWSREGERLPVMSLQIGHNLWIQNVNKNDTGRYICSARSSSHNKVIQDDITLIVKDSIAHIQSYQEQGHNWTVSIVPSKPFVKVGDSITLECLIKIQRSNNGSNLTGSHDLDSIIDIDGSIKREIGAGLGPVTWTNSNTGQSWFQDNVYIQDNLLIIYDLRLENAAIYRCNHNDIDQHTEYSLIVFEDNEEIERHKAAQSKSFSDSTRTTKTSNSSTTTNPMIDSISSTRESSDGHNEKQTALTGEQKFKKAMIKRAPIDSRVVLECPFNSKKARVSDIQKDYDQLELDAMIIRQQLTEIDRKDVIHYWWTRGPKGARLAMDQPLIINTVSTLDADAYICQGIFRKGSKFERFYYLPIILAVDRLLARFVQNPVSFIAMPTITGAYFQLKIELRFLPERDSGLILYNGQYKRSGDFISLGMNHGHLEFRFELGDGLTLLRSRSPLEMNQWHNVIIERDRRTATMLVDRQAAVSNTSSGKFYNLDLDSLLYIGGHQYYYDRYQANNLATRQLNRRANLLDKGSEVTLRDKRSSDGQTFDTTNGSWSGKQRNKFYGFSQGFYGCISNLRVSNQDINLTTKDRTVSIGIYECHHSQCHGSRCNSNHSLCQHEDFRPITDIDLNNRGTNQSIKPQLKCICFPGQAGPYCDSKSVDFPDSCAIGNSRQQRCNFPQGKCLHSQKPIILHDLNVDENHGCQCRMGFKGKGCGDRLISSASFSNLRESMEFYFDSSVYSWMAFQQIPTTTAMLKIKIQIKLKPSNRLFGKDSIILYSAQSSSGVGDHIMLCLRQDGHIEFNFDTGSGVITVRSQNSLFEANRTSISSQGHNPWAYIVVERDLSEASMQINDDPKVSRQLSDQIDQPLQHRQQSVSSQHLNRSTLNIGLPFYIGDIDRHRNLRLPSYAQYFQPFDGCIGQIVINNFEYDLSTLVTRSLMKNSSDVKYDFSDHILNHELSYANLPSWFLDSSNIKLCNQEERAGSISEDKRQQTQNQTISSVKNLNNMNATRLVPMQSDDTSNKTVLAGNTTSRNIFCDVLSPCANGATCNPIGTSAYKCHCPIGLMGDTCSTQAIFTPETTIQFNQNAYVSLKFVNLDELSRQQQQINSGSSQEKIFSNISTLLQFPSPPITTNTAGLNFTMLSKQLSMTEQQSISFILSTTANYGLIFYHGQSIDSQSQTNSPVDTKSVPTSDYIAIALVDGYIELSYELGSGVALIRSATKVNDDIYHKIMVTRNGRFGTLNIDGIHVQEGVSAGRLSMLNALGDIYLGGLPNASRITNNRYMTGFQGCLLDLELNRYGPVNLVKSDSLIQVTSGRNISPCLRKPKTQPTVGPNDDSEESDS